MTRRILIVDDDPAIRTSLSEALTEQGAEVRVADDGMTALPLLERFAPDLVLCDVRMPEIGGLPLLAMIRERCPAVDVILMTAYDDMGTIASAMRGGAVDFLVKPIGFSQLVAVTTRVFEDRRDRTRARHQQAAGSPAPSTSENALIGHDPRMIDIYKLVGQAAATTAT